MDQHKVILIVDDDQRNIFALRLTLKAKGYQVLSSTSASEAMEILEGNKGVALILMDMMMPEMDGYETIKNIRQHEDYARLPIIAVTAKSMIGDREKCIQAGASDYISKPVDIDQLLSLLRVWLYEN